MTPSTVSLLQHLLTRSDLTRLEVPADQVEAWLASEVLAPVAELAPADDEEGPGEQVFAVADADVRADLGSRLAAIGKPTVLLSPPRIRSFLHRAASGDSGPVAAGEETAAAIADQVPDSDLAQMLSDAIAALDGDMEIVVRLAEEEARLQSDGPAPAAEAPAATETMGSSEWFDAGELEAAMGKLDLGQAAADDDQVVTESVAVKGTPLEDLVPLADEGLEELAATVAFHNEQLERLVDLPHELQALKGELQQLRSAVQAGGTVATMSGDSTFDGRRTSLMAIGLALLCWSGLIWFGTGSATLALVSFVAANVIGCLALQPSGRRS
jgi:hypothetical protein